MGGAWEGVAGSGCSLTLAAAGEPLMKTGNSTPVKSTYSGLRRIFLKPDIFNRPGVAGAVLQTPPSLIH